MPNLRLSYVNVEHGGRDTSPGFSPYSGDGAGYDFGRVVGMFHDGDWPNVLVLGEGDRYELNGMEGALEAAAAMRAAGGPAYHPHPCSLPREGGMFAPVIYTTDAVQVRRFYNHRLPDFASRNRNTMFFTLPGSDAPFRIVAWHGDIHSGDGRLADARTFGRWADPTIPTALIGDFNQVPSGPHFAPKDLNTPGVHNPRQLAFRILWRSGRDWTGRYKYDSRAMDYLCGHWSRIRKKRVGGLGFHHVAELAGDYTPTQGAKPNGRRPLVFDAFLFNESLVPYYVPESYKVHTFRDPTDPDSDHRRVSVSIDIPGAPIPPASRAIDNDNGAAGTGIP
ncbi:hypothetical protein AB0H37_38290 [Actinomadura sp. NPDC023710]|uniref:endonuclease/exonuclease/phosphatase family protein n=1 Tax=Actinomadura sp. NPDC023710 TaxID=3158219 RepID=UPI00340A2167